MEEPTTCFFPTQGAPLPSNQGLPGLQAQPVSGTRVMLSATRNDNSTHQTQGHPGYSSTTAYIGGLNDENFLPTHASLQHHPHHTGQSTPSFPDAYDGWQPDVNGNGNGNDGVGNHGTGNHGIGNHGTGNHGIGNHGTGNHGTGNHGTGGDGATASFYHVSMAPDLAAQQPIPSSQHASILTPELCSSPPQASGYIQFTYPHWYETQPTDGNGSYIQSDGYSPHAVFSDDSTAAPLSEFSSKRRATIDTSFLQQPDGLPSYPATIIDSEPSSASSYYAVPQYSQPSRHRGPPEIPMYPAQYGIVEERQVAHQPLGSEKKVGPERMKRKRGRPPTRIDTFASRRTAPNDTSGISPLSSSYIIPSLPSEPIPGTGDAGRTKTGGRSTLQARNRAAANRYRAKTQAAMANLDAEGREVSLRRQSLLISAGELREQVFQLKNEVFRHANCGCPRIDGYLENAAQQTYDKQGLYSHPPSALSSVGGGSESSRSPSQSCQ
ncbi:hypothetical protein QBC43DRAFT_297980 [Cladorrhinum sp. PSN259]|nr:hypothetical protein QBC43DRAFT_297980 [Cladorrhinum sp. PSN259]